MQACTGKLRGGAQPASQHAEAPLGSHLYGDHGHV